MSKNYYAVIMAGGVGSRFWPLSKEVLPKQFLDLLGTGQTLIQRTHERLSKIIPEENIFILTSKAYEDIVKKELPQITDRRIVLEPEMKNTAPCILLSALKIQKENKDALMIVAPSDHWIEDEEEFANDVETAFEECAKAQTIMTLGIQPTFPHTGYGYIQYDKSDNRTIKKVLQFTEKPDYLTAKKFLKLGNYLWNAGIFIAQTRVLTQAFETYLPEMYAILNAGQSYYNTNRENEFLESDYQKVNNISIDYGIMEKADNVEVLPVLFDWNDLGSWGSLYDKLPKDQNRNVVIGAQAHFEDAEGNIIRTPEGRVVSVRGLNDFIVVENDEVLLIYPREKEQEIKNTRSDILNKFGNHLG